MTVYKEFKVGGGGGSPFGFFGPLLALGVIFTILFFVAKGVFALLNWAAIPLVIATLIIDHNVVIDYFKFMIKLLKENTLMGVVSVVVTIFAYPFVAGYLFFKALGLRQLRKFSDNIQKEKNTYADYEEVETEDTDFLELPPTPKAKPQPQSSRSDYDDMFK
jgi:hypothetical protein